MFLSTEKAGKTIHLLKEKSKPGASERKRRKIELLGTYEAYQSQKKGQAVAPQEPQGPIDPSQIVSSGLILQRGPNGQNIMAPPPGKGDQQMKKK